MCGVNGRGERREFSFEVKLFEKRCAKFYGASTVTEGSEHYSYDSLPSFKLHTTGMVIYAESRIQRLVAIDI